MEDTKLDDPKLLNVSVYMYMCLQLALEEHFGCSK